MTVGLYLHLPFCATHCTYCPFAISTDLAQQDAYTEALVREITATDEPMDGGPTDGGRPARYRRASRPAATTVDGRGDVQRLDGDDVRDGDTVQRGAGRPAPAGGTPAVPLVDTIYLGGGTPSRTSLENLTAIFAAIHQQFGISADAEVSMEANPEDVNPESLAAWKALGVNRLSIGVQSFHDDELEKISRIHDRARAIAAVRDAVSSGLRTNLDLMLGLPMQTAKRFRETLDLAVDLGAGHLSLYMLDLEERTPLEVQVSRGRVTLPEDDLVAELYTEAIERLGQAGLAQYEISNFARPGEECRHNLRYWTRGEYHGFGLAAHSFLEGRRFANTRDIRRYIELSPRATDFSEDLGAGEERRERIFLGLRRTSGIGYEELVALCGTEGIAWTERGLREGWLRRDGERVAFTPAGFLGSNDYISRLF